MEITSAVVELRYVVASMATMSGKWAFAEYLGMGASTAYAVDLIITRAHVENGGVGYMTGHIYTLEEGSWVRRRLTLEPASREGTTPRWVWEAVIENPGGQAIIVPMDAHPASVRELDALEKRIVAMVMAGNKKGSA